jgi:hypothetical protein
MYGAMGDVVYLATAETERARVGEEGRLVYRLTEEQQQMHEGLGEYVGSFMAVSCQSIR